MSLAWQPGSRLALVWRVLLATMGAVSACDAPTAPLVDFPARSVPWSPPAQYRFWWTLTEACAGRQGDMGAVQWYLWPEAGPILLDGKRYDGYWWQAGSRILLSDEFTDDGQVVRHEMLHQLLQRDGHPTEYFDERCGGVVSGTGASSAAPADPALVARARDVGPEVLTISLSTLPGRPSASVNGGWFVLDVQATNPTAEPIWVRLEPFFEGYVGLGYVVDGGGRTGTFDMPKEERIFFAPGQRRHRFFDLRERAPAMFPVRGFVSRGYSKPFTIVVEP
ncbi:MAG: hypothetical protein JWL95_2904 [Gemmatimonadetes bacterium]|nr:hypothetical protein [Gemmatimonadota bacterium]